MPLGLLLILVVGGISAVVLLVHFVGWSKKPGLTRDTAKRDFEWDHPKFPVTDLVLSSDGEAALIARADGGFGAIAVLGDGYVTRLLDDTDPADIDLNGSDLRINLRDFTEPGIIIRFDDAEQAHSWSGRLKGDVAV